MAVRLQMKLGVVAEHDRLDDSPDTLVIVEPSVGSVARSKGHLYLLVTSRISSRHALEATRLAAETIRNEYYYDESAGIRVCLQKAIATANKRLAHQADRLGLKTADGNGPIGVGVAVVRGSEMYVATVGPAEAYLIRQARLSTLPDPHRERGLPSGALEPDVWRGEISVGDSLVLISPNVIAKLGADELKDAMLTLHPQSAMEHLHHRFVSADGSGSDGAIAFEATEVSSTSRGRTLVPVRPAEPLAGAPDRSPIPLADNVQAAGIAVSAAAESARSAAGSAIERAVARLQDLMPQRKPAYRRVTPLSSRRETQRRAALAALALVVVVGSLGLGVYAFGGNAPSQAIASVNTGQKALDQVRADLAKVTGAGIDLITDSPAEALRLLTDAHQQLEIAAAAKVSATVIDPLRVQVNAGLDRLYGVVPVASNPLFVFQPAAGAGPIDLSAMVQGPDGNPYVIDRSTKAVYRINLKNKTATVVAKSGTKTSAGTVATPRFLGAGGQDLLILDSKNVLWRWRPADDTGKGTLTKPTLEGGASLGDDVLGINTFLRPGTRGLYNLYVIDPSEQQIRAVFAGRRRRRLPEQAERLAGDGARRFEDDLDLRGRRRLRDRRRLVGQVRRRQGRGLGRQGSEGHAVAPGAELFDRGRRERPSRRRHLRLRPPQPAGHRAVQGGRLLPGPVPAGRRCARLVGHARDVRHRRVRGYARLARLAVERGRQPGDPDGGAR